tara:strand:- start:6229 stop:6624 length:396 start_codon:yes stop_codon:yes gene_type:complete
MGRYYSGDIEGKFWFGLQSSNDGEYFGAVEDSWTQYEVYPDSLEDEVLPGIEQCRKELGAWEKRLAKYFKENNGYNPIAMAKELSNKHKQNINEEELRDLLTVYARLGLGIQIRDWMVANPGENLKFEAES